MYVLVRTKEVYIQISADNPQNAIPPIVYIADCVALHLTLMKMHMCDKKY